MTSIDCIKKIMEEQGVPIGWVAKKMGVSDQAVRFRLNSGKLKSMNVDTFVKLLDLLGYDLVVMSKYTSEFLVDEHRDQVISVSEK